jgi:hypothetical protein
LEDLAIVACRSDHFGGPVVRQPERLSGREVVPEQLLGPHVFPFQRRRHVGLRDPQRFRLDQRADRPVDRQAELLIPIAIGGDNRAQPESIRQERARAIRQCGELYGQIPTAKA